MSLWGFIFGVYVLINSTLLSFAYRGLPDLGVTLKVLGYGAIISFAIALSLSLIIAEIDKSKSKSVSTIKRA